VLGKAQDRSAVPALLDALHGRYFTVRAAAASALGQIGDAQAVDSLAGALKDGEAQVRSSAAMALASYNRPSTFDDIADLLLDDPEIEVRQAAARALGGTANPAALPHLMEALHDSFWWYERENAAVDLLNAIESMGSTAVPSLIGALQENEGTLRRFGANLLGRLRDARAVEPLGMTLYDLHHDVGNAAAEALGWFGAAALDVLAEALKHPEAGIRQHGIHGLSRIRDDRVLPLLTNMLRDPERGVRKGALQAVIELRDRRALPALEGFAADRSDRELSAMAKQALLEL
jgi:HEAT repeat protein